MAVAVAAAVGAALAGGTRTSSALPVPSGVASGDVVLVYLYLEDTGAVTPPAGFTEVVFSPAPETTSPVSRQRVWWKRATGADSGTYTFTHTSTWTSGGALRLTGAVASGTPVEVLASAQRAAAGTVTPTLSATTAAGDRLLVFGATVRNSSEWSPPSGFTEQFDPAGDELLIATKAQAAAGATGPLSASSTSSASQTVTLLAVVPVSVSSDTTPPSAPSNLVATATGPSTVSLSWDPATDNIAVAGYTVNRNGSPVTSGLTATSYGDSALSASTSYSYTVTAQDAAGNSSAASNTASATTGVALAPSLSVTATPEPGNDPPRVRLNVSDTRTTPATAVTVTRINPDGSVTPVRTTDGNPLPLSVSGTSRVGLVYDYEAPFGVAVQYSTTEAPGTLSEQVLLDSETTWIIHPGVPELSRPVTIADLGARSRKVSQSVFYPMGRSAPVVQTDGRRKTPEYTLSLYAPDDASSLWLDALLEDTGVLMLNIPASKNWGIGAEYISVGDVEETRPVRYLGEPSRVWNLQVTVVDRPGGGTQAERTYVDLLVYPTYVALQVAYPTYSDLLAGP